MVEAQIKAKGIEIILNNRVRSFSGNTALLGSGAEIKFDVLVVAVGVRPNIDLLREAGAKINRGIITDQFCRSSLENVYAAGDCAECYDIICAENRVLALLPNAYLQGECAGFNMTGAVSPGNKGIAMNAIGFFGCHVVTAGVYEGEDYTISSNSGYKRLFYKDDRLMGYIMVGDIMRAGIYTALIREQTPLSSLDFELIKTRPQLMAFSSAERGRKLGRTK
jgi:NAD(P)H-nitrite reductase large subunit